jgi:hypothetical protein
MLAFLLLNDGKDESNGGNGINQHDLVRMAE